MCPGLAQADRHLTYLSHATFPTDPGLAPHVRAAQPLLSFPEVNKPPLAGSTYVDLISIGAGEFVDPADPEVTPFWTSLVPATPPQNFAATWSGGFDVQSPGDYTFCIVSDGGFTLVIGKTRVLHRAITDPDPTACGTTSLTAGSHTVSADVFYGPSGVDALFDATYAGPDTGFVTLLF